MKASQHPKVLDWSDERSCGDPIMVTIAYGWAYDPDPDFRSASHVRGFDNAKEFLKAAKDIAPCNCLRCSSKGQKA